MADRIEKDSLGDVAVPAESYWGAQTERSRKNFTIGSEKMPIEIIRALALIKKAAARTNAALGSLSKDKADLISSVCDEIITGKLDDHFPLSVWQTGSGTQTNMNVNEVISNRISDKAGRPRGSHQPVHPNDHVNLSQSSNDVFPTAMHVAGLLLIRNQLIPALHTFRDALYQKALAFKEIIKTGRTHLMDAAPVTLGQEFSGYAAQVDQAIRSIEYHLGPLSQIALGGTAVGTGINAHPEFAEKVAKELSKLIGIPLESAPNKFAALASHDPIVGMSGALRQLAVVYMKIASDIGWMSSGPRCGLGELILPANEPGSSIMPGKVNPTQCEAMLMVAVHVLGLDSAIAIAGSQGNFELNVYKTLIAYNFLRAIHLLGDTALQFTHKCLEGLKADEDHIRKILSHSLMLATALNPVVGYDDASKIVRKAHAEGISLREAASQLGILTGQRFDAAIDPKKMVHPR